MNHFIFITHEGYTYQPNSESLEPDIENMQVIGFAEGVSAEDAMKNLEKENSYLKETSFDRIIGIELKSTKRTVLSLKNKNDLQSP